MILYHGSRLNLEKLEKRQAKSPNAEVPKGELQDAIYLTSDYGSAVAMAARPDGITTIDNTDKTIEFEKPEDFDPEADIYIYSVDSQDIPEELLDQVDELQYAALVPELAQKAKEKRKARDVMEFYELINWKEKDREKSKETGFKIR